jgi:hypothetical protein
MPKTILTDSPVRKNQRETHTRIKDIPNPDVSAVLYNDLHPDAERGLYLKAEKSGSKTWVYVWYRNGKRHVKKLEAWPKMKPAGARVAARNLANELSNPDFDPLPTRWSKAKQKQREAEEKARRAKAELTLGALLQEYVNHLEQRGRREHRAVENSLRRHVEKAFPDKWNAPVDELTLQDFREVIGKVYHDGKHRESQKVRAYLRAAYQAAIDAQSDVSVNPELIKFGIEHNPVASIKKPAPPARKERKKKAARKSLTQQELRAYWKRISALPAPEGAILRLALLIGGQRMRQLCRLEKGDLEKDRLILRDEKGRGRSSQPREHVVPLTPAISKALKDIGAKDQGKERPTYLVSLDGGKTPADPWAHVGKQTKVVAEAMVKAEEATEAFTGKMIRSTVRTQLGKRGIQPHVLDLLLSHGLGTVGFKHYEDESIYFNDKRRALDALHDLLNEEPAADVIEIGDKRRAKK